jgi:hypothetical protein
VSAVSKGVPETGEQVKGVFEWDRDIRCADRRRSRVPWAGPLEDRRKRYGCVVDPCVSGRNRWDSRSVPWTSCGRAA